jgi:hypothetical protein
MGLFRASLKIHLPANAIAKFGHGCSMDKCRRRFKYINRYMYQRENTRDCSPDANLRHVCELGIRQHGHYWAGAKMISLASLGQHNNDSAD